MTLSEFLNGYHGYLDNQQFEQRQAWERSRFILSGLVKKPPVFPWDEGEDQGPYSEEEIEEIVAYHERIEHNAKRKQKLTKDGWVDVDSGPKSTD